MIWKEKEEWKLQIRTCIVSIGQENKIWILKIKRKKSWSMVPVSVVSVTDIASSLPAEGKKFWFAQTDFF